MEEIFNIDWDVFRKIFTPSIRRRTKYMALISAYLKPVSDLYDKFVVFKENTLYKLRHDGSIGSLENLLNDYFDTEQRRIYIENARRIDALRLYTIPAEKPLPLGNNLPLALRTSNDNLNNGADFYVYLPLDIQPDSEIPLNGLLIQIRGQLDYYKLFDKQYKIIWTD